MEKNIGRECIERKLAYPLVQPTNNQRAQLTRDAHRRVGSAEAHKRVTLSTVPRPPPPPPRPRR